jgi:hypothetical protein
MAPSAAGSGAAPSAAARSAARTGPRSAASSAAVGGAPSTSGRRSPAVAAAVRAAAGDGARLVEATGPERFDILPLLVATDGAIDAFGYDRRRLRPNVVIGAVEGLAERGWEGRLLAAGDAVIALADLRGRCVITTWDPDTLEQDVGVLRRIRARFDGRLALNAWAGREGVVVVGDAVALLDRPVDLALPALGRFVAA